ncbi:DUF4127 family protein [Pelosinus sp. sgz500959]|uniref:DUF4127 family protein n=1 Tax=Pelosinus sp. sgz500959 TaxID=3242472 RepID=UPI00366C8499
MLKSHKSPFLLMILLILISIGSYSYNVKSHHSKPISIDYKDFNQHWLTILLLPLDSRPPCTQFVVQLAEMAGINLLMPPPELLDHDQTPANKVALRNWLYETSKQTHVAIISTDMLIHGSLVASRLSTGTTLDREDVLALLETIHQEVPNLQMYIFNIIPRLILADSQGNAVFQKYMLKYSILIDQIYTFENIEDIKKLTALEKQIPAAVINHYIAMYEENTKLNMRLMDMVDAGIISGLVIGQDDGQPFGIPNISKEKIQHQLLQKPHLKDKVFITRGTDEVALTLLGHIVTQRSTIQPRVFVKYSTPEASQITMPFMPNTVGKTVEEKLNLAGCLPVDTAEQADFILYVHIGTGKNKSALSASAHELQNLLNQDYKVALVDLTEDFQFSETLLPVLIKQHADITKFIAYAGWNSTSNSIGTAITQASIFNYALTKQTSLPERLSLYQQNLEFLTARFLDDLYYQKEINPSTNKELQRLHVDPYHLASRYYQTNYEIQKRMFSKARLLLREGLSNHPITVDSTQGSQKIIITDLSIKTYLPWQRTFEIWLTPTLSLGMITD